ncbi:unnamed protein product [Lampetra fluviatilis]
MLGSSHLGEGGGGERGGGGATRRGANGSLASVESPDSRCDSSPPAHICPSTLLTHPISRADLHLGVHSQEPRMILPPPPRYGVPMRSTGPDPTAIFRLPKSDFHAQRHDKEWRCVNPTRSEIKVREVTVSAGCMMHCDSSLGLEERRSAGWKTAKAGRTVQLCNQHCCCGQQVREAHVAYTPSSSGRRQRKVIVPRPLLRRDRLLGTNYGGPRFWGCLGDHLSTIFFV